MDTSILTQWMSEQATLALPFLVDAAAKGLVMLLFAGIVCLLLRRSSAAARHALWSATAGALIAVPVLSAILPQWHIVPTPRWDLAPASTPRKEAPVMPAPLARPPKAQPTQVAGAFVRSPVPSAAKVSSEARASAPATPIAMDSGVFRPSDPSQAPAITISVPHANPTRAARSPAVLIAILYITGVALVLIRPILGLIALVRLRRRTMRVSDEVILDVARQCAQRLLLRRKPVLLLGTARCMPMTWGSVVPRVLLPADALDWPVDRLRVVLLHELAHVKRLDCLTQSVARLACALYWFNPLAWLAAWRMRVEREQACDDLVLSHGARNSDYAEHLLHVATSGTRSVGFAPAAAVAMAKPGSLEWRLRAILDIKRSRTGVTHAALLAVVLALGLFVLPVSMLRGRLEPAAHAAQNQPPGEDRAFELTVVDAKTKQPLPDVAVGFNWDGKSRKDRTDAKGRCWLMLPAQDPKSLSVSAKAPRYVGVSMTWRPEVEKLPEAYTLELEVGTVIGGIVKDEEGKPIEGVTVNLLVPSNPGQTGRRIASGESKFITDAEGKWTCDTVPAKLDDVWLRLAHPDFISDEMYGSSPKPSMEELRKSTGVMVMKKGALLAGSVTDENGVPIENAAVKQGRDRWGSNFPEVRTDGNGQFAFGNCRPGEMILTVQVKGYAPDVKRIMVSKDNEPVTFKLTPPRTFRARFVDEEGNPVRGAWMTADTWRTYRSINWRVDSDADGRVVWEDAPADAVLYDMGKQGYRFIRNRSLIAGDQEHVITLQKPLIVSGSVTDVETGKPIDKFRYQVGIQWIGQESPTWQPHDVRGGGANGKYEYLMQDGTNPHFLKFEAQGYLPVISEVLNPEDRGAKTFDVKMTRGVGPSGVVLLPDGKPAAEAQLLLCTANSGAHLQNGRVQNHMPGLGVITAADGKFSFMPQTENYVVVVVHDQGYAEASKEQVAKSPVQIQLKAWGAVEGTVMIGTRPAANQQVAMYYPGGQDRGDPRLYFNYDARTDEKGKFRINRVRPGNVQVARMIPLESGGRNMGAMYSHATPVKVEAGKVAQVTIGGKGRPVMGTLDLPKDLPEGFQIGQANLATRQPEYKRPENFEKLSEEEQKKAWIEFAKSAIYQAWQKNQRHYGVPIKPDGTFRVEDIEPGDYTFSASVNAQGTDRMPWGEQIAHATKQITVPAIPGGVSDEALDIGTLPVTMLKLVPIAAGQPIPPELKGKTPDGKDLSVGDFRGKVLLLHIWASWQPATMAQTKQIQAAHDAFKEDKGFTVLSLSLDHSGDVFKKWVDENKPTWPVAHNSAWTQDNSLGANVQFLLTTCVIDAEGKVIARDLVGENIKATVEQALEK